MIMRSNEAGGVIILRITGTLAVGGNNRLLREHVDELLKAGLKNILVDVAAVTYIDSSGVGELLMARETVSVSGGEIKLLNLGKRTRDISHATILSTAFQTFEDEPSAILSYSVSKPFDPAAVERAEIGSEFCWIDGWPRLVGPRG
jgi:anti-sigma B factor antagonist